MNWGYVLSFFVGFFVGEWFYASWIAYKKNRGVDKHDEERL